MNNKMYDVVKNVIASRNYDLKDILGKIETVWVQSRITDEQKVELISLAQENAKVENSIDILNKLYDLDRRVAALENKDKADEPTEDETESPTYPPYTTGAWYYNGDIVSYEGQNYKCIAPEEKPCTWSPAEYPPYWEVYVEVPEEEPEEEEEAEETTE